MKKIFAVVMSLICAFSFSFTDVKATTTFYMPFTEPTKNENSGYLNVCVRDTTTNKYHNLCIFWGLYGYVSNNTEYVDFHPQVEVKVTSSSITLTFYTYSSLAESVGYHIGHCWNDGYYSIQKSGFTNGNYTYTYNFDGGRYVPQGVEVLGNGALVSESIGNNIFLVSWGENNALIEAIKAEFNGTNNILSSMSSTLDNSIIAVKNAVTSIGSNIVSSITSMSSAVTSKLDDLLNYFKGDENTDNTVNDNTSSNNQLNDTVNQYDQIESGMIDDFNTNIGNIDTTNNLFALGDFIATGTFVSTQMTNIYNSNQIVQYMITFGLILGIALTVIGISTKR